MFEIHPAMARALSKTTKPSAAGINFNSTGSTSTGTGCLGMEHLAQYRPSSRMLAPPSSPPISRTSIKAPRSGASMREKLNVIRQRRLERRILRRRADIAEVFGCAAEFQFRRPAIGAVGGNRDGGQVVFSIRQRKTETERAVGTQFDFV